MLCIQEQTWIFIFGDIPLNADSLFIILSPTRTLIFLNRNEEVNHQQEEDMKESTNNYSTRVELLNEVGGSKIEVM